MTRIEITSHPFVSQTNVIQFAREIIYPQGHCAHAVKHLANVEMIVVAIVACEKTHRSIIGFALTHRQHR